MKNAKYKKDTHVPGLTKVFSGELQIGSIHKDQVGYFFFDIRTERKSEYFKTVKLAKNYIKDNVE